ncbi:MAG: ComEC family competence protein [Chitinophagaceae bacterium]|nr:ComEC family competence protein [Chitinophagaceae bacterium]MCW5904327.1 ComEC family competence protein [Chitinophagaceae bacterium]
MLRQFNKLFYKQTPAFRLLLPLIVGILVQYHFQLSLSIFIYIAVVALLLFIGYEILPSAKKYSYNWTSGIAIVLFLIAVGGSISYIKNIEHQPQWIGKYAQNSIAVKLTLKEPIVQKQNSFKALAQAETVLINNQWQPVKGDVLLYFKKDSSKPNLQYGYQIVVAKKLMPIINAGNPGGFNYARYCSFQNIHYQAFLNDEDFITLSTTETNWFDKLIIQARTKVLTILKTYIKGNNELSIAEALLIGYRDNLDRDLVQSYSNTGVVHIIAISGLHLGMIYGLLIFLFKPFIKYKWSKVVKPLVILIVLWGFSFIAGAAPSILRSAVMFSFIVLGETISKKTNIYNSLAASAFLLLLINPFNLWDVGFQLSYSAVLSIVVFQKYINNWFYFKHKFLRDFWSLNAVTLSAQILTLPIVLYHFHQFPTLFLFTNLLAVPFSGFILYIELLLLVVASFSFIGIYVGKLIEWSIELMNHFILYADSIPFSVWPSIQINILQAIILYAAIIGFWMWIYYKKPSIFVIALGFFSGFILLRSINFIQRNKQQKLVVYNVSNHTAIDIIEGRKYYFIGDSILTKDGFLRNFHLKPSRILHRITPENQPKSFSIHQNLISCNRKNILIIDDNTFETPELSKKIDVDVIVLTKNPKIYLNKLSNTFSCKQYVFDSSNPFWKVAYWKKDADSLHLQYHATATDGAFVMNF